VFKYSQREGTPASKFKSQIDGYVKHERSEILIKIGNEMREDFEEKFIGKSMPVLYEEDAKDKKGYVEGYTTNYMRVISKNRKSLKGKIVSTKIIKLAGEKLIGEIEEF
jgi:threonylcarbamoyladenosine tRNA methylthiotransferase MtaB